MTAVLAERPAAAALVCPGDTSAAPVPSSLWGEVVADRADVPAWSDLPANGQGAVQAMWAAVLAGQRAPWRIGMAGWRYLRRTAPDLLAGREADDMIRRVALQQLGREVADRMVAAVDPRLGRSLALARAGRPARCAGGCRAVVAAAWVLRTGQDWHGSCPAPAAAPRGVR